MSSSRLPGKVLMPIGGSTALESVVERLTGCAELDEVAVATSERDDDDRVAAVAEAMGAKVVRGSLEDVLARYELAASILEPDAVVRITADCPLVAPELVDRLVRLWRRSGADYVANSVEPRTFPKGLDAEVVSRDALAVAASRAEDPYEREHVTPYIRRRPDAFATRGLWMTPSAGDVRITLDTEDDYARLTTLAAAIGPDPTLDQIFAELGIAEPTVTEVAPATG